MSFYELIVFELPWNDLGCQFAQACARPSWRVVSCRCGWWFNGWNDCVRMAVVHAKGICSTHRPHCHLLTSLCVVHQLGRSTKTEYLHRPRIRRWILYQTTCFRPRSCTHDGIAHLPLARLLRKPIRSHATTYSPTRNSGSHHATTFSAYGSLGRPRRSQRRPPECAPSVEAAVDISFPPLLCTIIPPVPRKQVCGSFRC